jgi:hypothetical membrane protein
MLPMTDATHTRPHPPAASERRTATWTPTQILTAIGAAGPIVFLGTATLAGFLTPGYDVRTQTVSELAVGPLGWLMTAAFYAFGLSMIAFAIGLHRGLRRRPWGGPLLLAAAGVGIIASGLYPTDVKGAPETEVGAIHNQLFLVVFLALNVAYVVTALALRREPGWRGFARWTALMPVAVIGLMVVFIAVGSDPGDPLYLVSGLIQRALLLVAFGWITVTGRRLLERRPNS